MMKKTILALFVTVIALSLYSCTNNDIKREYSLEQIHGEWIWMYIDGEPIETQRISLDCIAADGNSHGWSGLQKECNRWEKLNFKSSIDGDILTNAYDSVSYSYKIISYSPGTLIVQYTGSGKIFEARRAYEDFRDEIVGRWTATFTDGTIATSQYDVDGGFSFNFLKDNQTTTYTGDYFLKGCLLVCQTEDNYYSNIINFDYTDEGVKMMVSVADSTHNITTVFHSKRAN